MEDKDFERLAELAKKRAEQEIAGMEQTLKTTEQNIENQQKEITENIINDHIETIESKKSTWLILLILIAILAGSYYSLTVFKPTSQYNKAVGMLENKQYDNARAIFVSLGEFKDSAELIKECDYRKGCYLMATGKYGSAITALSRIKGYKDRDDLVLDMAGEIKQTMATSENHSVFVRSVGTVKAVGSNDNGQCNVMDWRDIKSVACGMDFTVGLTSTDGRVLCTNGEINWQGIKKIAAGDNFVVGLSQDGQLNKWGSIDISVISGSAIDIKAQGNILACLMDNGSVQVTGTTLKYPMQGINEIAVDSNGIVYGLQSDGIVINSYGEKLPFTDIKHIFSGGNTIVAIDKNNKINTNNNIFSSTCFNGMLMLAPAKNHCLVLMENGYVKFVGNANDSGADNVNDWTDILIEPIK